jgi:hypothetical protein
VIENTSRLTLLDRLLDAPRTSQDLMAKAHQETLEADPQFYGCLAAWYQRNGFVEAHKELFIANLSLSFEEGHREAAYVMLQPLRTYQVARVVRYLKEARHKMPRRTKSAVEYWLRRREADALWFDEVFLRDRKNVKYLYATLQIKPSTRAKAIVFEEEPPKDSRVFVVQQLSKNNDPDHIAEQIVAHKINAATAVGLLPYMNEKILAALIQVMTPQQLLNRMASLRRRGAFEDKKMRSLIEEKMLQAASEKRVQDGRLLIAAQASGDDLLNAQLGQLSAQRLQQKGSIKRPTAIFVDKSGSMQVALEVGAHVASLCSAIVERELWVYAFDSFARPIKAPEQKNLIGWSRAFSSIHADGATSIGAPFVSLAKEKSAAEQIIVITDGEENTAPYFVPALREYEAKTQQRCQVIVVIVGQKVLGRSALEVSLQQEKIEHQCILFQGDLYSLPNLIPYVTTPRRAELCAEIMMSELPTREALHHLPPGFDHQSFEIL